MPTPTMVMKGLLLFLTIRQTASQGCDKTFPNDSGILDSPKPEDHVANQATKCSFRLQPQKSATVSVKFSEFNLKEKDEFNTCFRDVLTFATEEPGYTNPPTWCGKQSGLRKFLTAKSIDVKFRIGDDGKSYFKATYTVCRFQFNSSFGDLSTGPFITAENDGKLLICQFLIKEDSAIFLDVNRSKTSCGDGFLEILIDSEKDTEWMEVNKRMDDDIQCIKKCKRCMLGALLLHVRSYDVDIEVNIVIIDDSMIIQENQTEFRLSSDGNNGVPQMETYYFPRGFVDIFLNITCNISGPFATYRTESADDFSQAFRRSTGSFEPRLFHQKYANNAKYKFNITTDIGGRLILSFDDVDFGANCSDFVSILAIDNSEITRLCRENITSQAVIIPSDTVSVYFITDLHGSGKGFKGFWSTSFHPVLHNAVCTMACGGKYTDSVGDIRTPRHNLRPYNVSYEAECDYTIHVTGAERIYMLLNASQANLHLKSAAENIGNNAYEVNNDSLTFNYKSSSNDDFQVLYIACGITLTNQSRSLEIDRRNLEAIAPGYNCTFKIQNREFVKLEILFQVQNVTDACTGDFIKIQHYPKKNDKRLETAVICGLATEVTTYHSWGSVWITYVSVDHSTLQFKAEYNIEKGNGIEFADIPNSGSSIQSTSGFWKKIIRSEIFIPVLAASGGLIMLIVITAAVVSYRRKKRAVQEIVWLSDKATSTLDRSFIPFLPDADDADDSYKNRGEIIIGFGEYAEVVFPNDKRTCQEVPVICNDHRRSEVSTFSLHRSHTGSTIPVSSMANNNIFNRNEYSTPWDAKNEKDKLVKVMSLKCPAERKPSVHEVFEDFPFHAQADDSFGIPCTDETTEERNRVLPSKIFQSSKFNGIQE